MYYSKLQCAMLFYSVTPVCVVLLKVLHNRLNLYETFNFNTDILLFRWLVLFCIAIPYYTNMSWFCSSVSVFGFGGAVYLFACLEASHTTYSLAPFLLPDRPTVPYWCTMGEIHTRGRLFLIQHEQVDNRHVENSIHTVFPKEVANLSDKKLQVHAGLWRPKAVSSILIRLVLTVAMS